MNAAHERVEQECLALRDGARVCFRRLEPVDRPVLEEVFGGLSEESRRARFHGPKPRLGADDLAMLLAVDHRNHEALVAFEESTWRPVAIARFVRDRVEPDLADVAFEVVDDWHGRGVGTLLVHRLTRRALALRVERFRAFVVGTNERAKAVLQRTGRVARSRLEGPSVEVVVELRCAYEAASAA